MKKFISGLLMLAMLFSATYTGGAANENDAESNSESESNSPKAENAAGTLTLENSQAVFTYEKENNTFLLEDKISGKKWHSNLTDENYSGVKDNDYLNTNRKQLFSFTYCDAENNVTACSSTEEVCNINASLKGDAIVLDVVSNEAGIAFGIVFTLKDQTLKATVPAASVREKSSRLCTVELLTFFGASDRKTDGYIFFPDGSGAIFDFQNKSNVMRYPYKAQVYSNYFTELDDYIKQGVTGAKWVMLPVFGVKQGDAALTGIITNGDADSTVCFYPDGFLYSASRVCPIFNYRYSYSLETTSNDNIILFEKNRSDSDFSVEYTMLSGESANYSGMAANYREYLLNNGLLNTSEYSPTVNLDLLMSVKKPVLFWETSVAMSQFSYGTHIAKTLDSLGVKDVSLTLLGWQSGGYNIYPSHFPVSSKAGGKNELKKMISESGKYGQTVNLLDDFMQADQKRGGYSKRKDVASSVKNEAYTDMNKKQFLLDFRHQQETFEKKFVKKALNLNVSSVAFDNIGRLIYANGSKKNELRRDGAVRTVQSMLETASSSFSKVTVSGGNAYVLKNADFLRDIPQSSSNNTVFDRSVPFFQIVVHGYIPYAPEIPGNFSDNYENTVLKWIEYGFVPHYSMSQKDAGELKNSYNKGIFVSKFSDWQNTVSESVKEIGAIAEKTRSPIRSHTVLPDSLTETIYENGAKIIVNYTDSALPYEGAEVAPRSYLLIE